MKKTTKLLLGFTLSLFLLQATSFGQCPIPKNPKINIDAGSHTSTQLSKPFDYGIVSDWETDHGVPTTSSTNFSTATSVRLRAWQAGLGDGIVTKTKYNFTVGKQYIAIFRYRKTGTLNTDSVVLALSPDIVPSNNSFIIHRGFNIKPICVATNVSDTNWKTAVVCFNAPYTSANLYLYTRDETHHQTWGGNGTEVLVDNIEIVKNWGFAGPDTVACSGSPVTLGEPGCGFTNFTTARDWFDSTGMYINSIGTMINAGWYVVRRVLTISSYSGSAPGCTTQSDTVILKTGTNPPFSLLSPTICASASITLAPVIVPPGAYPYKYTWTIPCKNPVNTPTYTTNVQGTYYLTIEDSTSRCKTTRSATVTVNPNLKGTRTYYVCKGSFPYNLCTVPGFTSYTYYDLNRTPVTGITLGSNNCKSVDSLFAVGRIRTFVFKVVTGACTGWDTIKLQIVDSLPRMFPRDTVLCGTGPLVIGGIDPRFYKVKLDSTTTYYIDSVACKYYSSYNIYKSGTYIATTYDKSGCSRNDTMKVTFDTVPPITMANYPLGTYCNNRDSVLLDTLALPSGGVFTGTAVYYDTTGHRYYFKKALATCGSNKITYIYTDSNGCSGSKDAFVYRWCGNHFDSLRAYYCQSDSDVILRGFPPFGNFTGPGVYWDSASGYYKFKPKATNPSIPYSTYRLYFNYTDSGGCYGTDSINVKVYPGPTFKVRHALDRFACGDTLKAGMKCVKDGVRAWVELDTMSYPGSTYYWSNSSTQKTATYYTKGPHWVKITTPTGCSTTDSFTFVNDPCVCCLKDSPYYTFERNYLKNGYIVEPVAIRATPWDTGYIVLAGYSAVTYNNYTRQNTQYIRLIKLDKKGMQKWSKKYFFDYNVFPTDLEIDDTNFVILGDHYINDTPNGSHNSENYQVFIMRTNLSGVYRDIAYYGGRGTDHGHDLLVTEDGYVFCGSGRRVYQDMRYNPYSQNGAHNDWTFGRPNVCGTFDDCEQSMYLVKVDTINLSPIWEHLYSEFTDTCATVGYLNGAVAFAHVAAENGVRVIKNNMGNYVILGNTARSESSCTYPNPTITDHTSDMFLLEVNSNNGNIIQKSRYGVDGFGDSTTAYNVDIAVDLKQVGNDYMILGYSNVDVTNLPNYFRDSLWRVFVGRVKSSNLNYATQGLFPPIPLAYLYSTSDTFAAEALSMVEKMGNYHIVANVYGGVNQGWVPMTFGVTADSGNLFTDSAHLYDQTGYDYNISISHPQSPVGNYIDVADSYGGFVLAGQTEPGGGWSSARGLVVKTDPSGKSNCEIKKKMVRQNYPNKDNIILEELTPCDWYFYNYTPEESDVDTLDVLCCGEPVSDTIIVESGGGGGGPTFASPLPLSGGEVRGVRKDAFNNRGRKTALQMRPTDKTKASDVAETLLGLSIRPNPANNQIEISYTLPVKTAVKISLENAVGKQVADIINNRTDEAGNYKIGYTFELAKGIYLIRLQTQVGTKTLKLVVQ